MGVWLGLSCPTSNSTYAPSIVIGLNPACLLPYLLEESFLAYLHLYFNYLPACLSLSLSTSSSNCIPARSPSYCLCVSPLTRILQRVRDSLSSIIPCLSNKDFPHNLVSICPSPCVYTRVTFSSPKITIFHIVIDAGAACNQQQAFSDYIPKLQTPLHFIDHLPRPLFTWVLYLVDDVPKPK